MTLCGGYQLGPARAHPLLHDLPDMIHIPARLGHRAQLHAAVGLLAGELDHPRLGTIVPGTAPGRYRRQSQARTRSEQHHLA